MANSFSNGTTQPGYIADSNTASTFMTNAGLTIGAPVATATNATFAVTEAFSDSASFAVFKDKVLTFSANETSLTTGNSIYGATTYSGSENNDGATGLTLGAVFSAFAPVTITHVKFWKTSIDTATSRTVAIYDVSGTVMASGTSSGEPVGTAQWINVPLTVPLSMPGNGLTTPYIAAVYFAQQRYGAVAGFYNTGHYSADSKLYGLTNSEAVTAGFPGNGLFIYNAPMAPPTGTFGSGNYQIDVVYSYGTAMADTAAMTVTAAKLVTFAATEAFSDSAAFALQNGVNLTFTTTEAFSDGGAFNVKLGTDVIINQPIETFHDSGAFTVTLTTPVTPVDATFAVTEGFSDSGAFTLTLSQHASFGITEPFSDSGAFALTLSQHATFGITEGFTDTAAFTITNPLVVTFGVTEGFSDAGAFNTKFSTGAALATTEGFSDAGAFSLQHGYNVAFDTNEGFIDIAQFNLGVATNIDFTVTEQFHDTFYGYVFPVYWQKGFDDAYFTFVQPENRVTNVPDEIQIIYIKAEDRTSNLQDEWQRVDVDQPIGRRKFHATE